MTKGNSGISYKEVHQNERCQEEHEHGKSISSDSESSGLHSFINVDENEDYSGSNIAENNTSPTNSLPQFTSNYQLLISALKFLPPVLASAKSGLPLYHLTRDITQKYSALSSISSPYFAGFVALLGSTTTSAFYMEQFEVFCKNASDRLSRMSSLSSQSLNFTSSAPDEISERSSPVSSHGSSGSFDTNPHYQRPSPAKIYCFLFGMFYCCASAAMVWNYSKLDEIADDFSSPYNRTTIQLITGVLAVATAIVNFAIGYEKTAAVSRLRSVYSDFFKLNIAYWLKPIDEYKGLTDQVRILNALELLSRKFGKISLSTSNDTQTNSVYEILLSGSKQPVKIETILRAIQDKMSTVVNPPVMQVFPNQRIPLCFQINDHLGITLNSFKNTINFFAGILSVLAVMQNFFSVLDFLNENDDWHAVNVVISLLCSVGPLCLNLTWDAGSKLEPSFAGCLGIQPISSSTKPTHQNQLIKSLAWVLTLLQSCQGYYYSNESLQKQSWANSNQAIIPVIAFSGAFYMLVTKIDSAISKFHVWIEKARCCSNRVEESALSAKLINSDERKDKKTIEFSQALLKLLADQHAKFDPANQGPLNDIQEYINCSHIRQLLFSTETSTANHNGNYENAIHPNQNPC